MFGRWQLAILSEWLTGTLATWAGLLAIFAAVSVTGLIDISVDPKVQVLEPTSIVRQEHLRKNLSDAGYGAIDSVINRVFQGRSTLIVDAPSERAIMLREGGVIAQTFQGVNGETFTYKNLTDGSKYFRTGRWAWDIEKEVTGRSHRVEDSQPIMSRQDSLQPLHKKIQVMPFFSDLIVKSYNSDYRFLRTDSISKIIEEFHSIKTDPPLFLDMALFNSRRVYSIVSIENDKEFDISNIGVRFFKRYGDLADDLLSLEAWTVGIPAVSVVQRLGQEISLTVANLPAHDDLQIIVSSWHTQIRAEDIYITYDRYSSIDKYMLMWVVITSFALAALVRFPFRRF